MAEKTGIAWASSTFNPWTGCQKVSAGCKNCYMFTLLARGGRDANVRKRTVDWGKVRRWNRQAEEEGIRRKVFPSLCDWLDDQVPVEWLADFLKLIQETPWLDWQLLTKRPENWRGRIEGALSGIVETDDGAAEWLDAWMDCIDMPERGDIPQNVWIGVSVENKENKPRLELARQIPARIRFVSLEPLLDDPELTAEDLKDFHWAIPGGESGGGRRQPVGGVSTIEKVALDCKRLKLKVFVKQDCSFRPGQRGALSDEVWALKEFPA